MRQDQLNGKNQMCVLIDGAKISSPVATIEIDTPYLKGEVEAWCIQNPVCDLIVGNIERARLPGEPDPNWQLVQAVETRAQKKEAKTYKKLKVPECGGNPRFWPSGLFYSHDCNLSKKNNTIRCNKHTIFYFIFFPTFYFIPLCFLH